MERLLILRAITQSPGWERKTPDIHKLVSETSRILPDWGVAFEPVTLEFTLQLCKGVYKQKNKKEQNLRTW